MTAQHFRPIQHPPRIRRRHAAGHLVVLMLMLWLCDLIAGGTAALAQNIVSTPSALSFTVAQGGMVNNFLGPGRIYRLPLRGLRSKATQRIRPTQTGLPILYAGVPRPYRRKKFPRAFLRERFPRKVRAASEIFACLFAFDPLGSPLKDILTGFSPNSAERFPTIN